MALRRRRALDPRRPHDAQLGQSPCGPTSDGEDLTGQDLASENLESLDAAGPDPDLPDDAEWAALTSATDGPHGLVAVGFAGTSSETARAVVWTSP